MKLERLPLPHPAVAVFTSKTLETLLAQGGSGPWVGAAERVKRQEYLVCIRKTKEPGSEGHGSAFLVGKIKGVREHGFDRRGQQRWFFEISDYAIPNRAGHWEWRNPVRYMTLEELKIEPKSLKFESAPAPTEDPPVLEAPSSVKPLTLAEAKAGLAAKFGVSPDAIDIHIKG
jgi:hypothetical protein